MTARATVLRGDWPDVTTVAEAMACLPRPSEQATRTVQVAGEQVTLNVHHVKVAPDADVQPGDTLTITKTADSYLEGRHLTVLEVITDEWITSRRLVCIEARARSGRPPA